MFIYFSKKENYKKLAVFVLFGFFFLIGVLSYKDYGISVDEWELRLLGYANLKYVFNIFLNQGFINLIKYFKYQFFPIILVRMEQYLHCQQHL